MWQTQFVVVEHYPDGNSSGIVGFSTEKEAQDFIANHYYDCCTVEQRQVFVLPKGKTAVCTKDGINLED